MGNTLVELIAQGLHVAQLGLEVAQLLAELVPLSVDALQAVIEILDPLATAARNLGM